LLKITEAKNRVSQENIIYVIGESHSLPYSSIEIAYQSNIWQTQVMWIPGCKQYHLGNNQPNHYKAAVKHYFQSLSKKSTVLMVIGEIDCRANEGILKYAYKNPNQDIENVIKKTISSYLDWLIHLNIDMEHNIIISGVPDSNASLDGLLVIGKEVFADFLAKFNQILQTETLKIGFKFLDIYSMTRSEIDSYNKKKWHIDEYHLSPLAGQEAFKKYLVC